MAVDRKQQMKEITERLEQGVKDVFTSEMYTTYLRTMAKFHNYSFNNTLLIAMQRPDATLVAGFNAWKNKFNRYVKKGEKGIQIIAPAPIKEVEEREKIDKDTGLAVLNENGEPEMERVEYVVPRFRLTTVFDISQTDGEPIPSLEVNELTASVKDYALLTAAIEQVSPVPMRFDEIKGDAKGYYSDADKEICIQVGMGESQTVKTMIHEVAHAMLHNSDFMKKNGEEKDRLTKETEAESIAFTVCAALDIDTSDYSFPYVASWASGKEMKELKDSMDTIRLTAADFLEKLEAAVAERSAERMTAMQYAEKLIANKEQEKTIFDDEQRNLIVNLAFKLDDRAATEELVNGLTAALAEDDKEEANRLMYDAQEKIENLPDGMIGFSEMHDYGYRKDDVLPLTKEGAREWHRLGERIYPLFRDGTAGDYVSQEEIEQHDGIFGIKADAWDAILLEQREDYAENEYARPDFKLTVINREQALRLYDEGKQIYLVRISPWPILVTAREEIERGSDTFQIAIADLEQERNMTEQENMLLYGSEKQFGIYQITERDPEHDYRFMGLDYVQKKGMTVARADYDLIYAAPLTEKDTLDGIYERFNIQRPADFTGHSLSVSDVVVLNDGSTVKAYYVDSIGFAELPEFFKERNLDLQKENLLNEKLQEIEIFDKPGLFSNGRLRDEDVPEGLYRYDLRGSDYDPGQPITVEKTVVVNHAASVLMAEELDLGAEGRLELGEEGLNFTGAELTVREFMEEQQQKNNVLIHGDSDHITVEGHIGTWYAIDETEIGGEKFFLLEHEEHGDMAACVVRSIYRRKLEGMSAQAIAEQLNSENVLAPSEYKRLCGLNYHSGFKAGTHAKWQAIQVLRILKNEVYTGTMVQGRRQKINYKIKKIRDVEESGWIRVPNMHEAIIPQKLFDTVQEVLKLDTCASKGQQTVNLFSGIVRCGGCGQNMVRRTVSKNGKKYIYLHCVTNHNGLGCSSHLISESKLEEVVLVALQEKIQQISGLEHRLDEINEIPKNERRLKSVEEHLKMLEQEEQKYQTLRRQLYEDMSSGIVSKEEYKEFSHSFNEKVETIRKAKAEMNRQRDCLNNLDVEHLPWIEDFKSYQNLTSLNRRVLVELVESITVYDKEHIHIQYRFDQEIRNVLEYCSSVPAAETEESAV